MGSVVENWKIVLGGVDLLKPISFNRPIKLQLKINGIDLLEPFQYIQEAGFTFWTFVVFNLVIGTLGVWSPVLFSLFRTDLEATPRMVDQLQQGALYLFAIPFLATSLGGVLSVLAEDKNPTRTIMRLSMLVFCGVWLLFMVLFLSAQTGFGANPLKLQTPWTIYVLQPICFAFTCILGVYVFCLANFHRDGANVALEDDRNRDEIIRNAAGATDDVAGLRLDAQS